MQRRATATALPIDRLWPVRTATEKALRVTAVALIGSLLLTLSAKTQVPFWPVPVTMQTAVVLLFGVAFGWRLGLATVLLYLAEGAMGMPVFAGTPSKGLGLAYMAGPTGGYIAAWLFEVVLVGLVAERSRSLPALAATIFAVAMAALLVGGLWLAQFVGLEKAWTLGVAPFILGDLTKAALVTMLAAAGLGRLRQRGSLDA